jgi:hypothetical protein
VRNRAVAVLATVLLAVAAAGCGTEPSPEELVAVPIQRETTPPPAPPTLEVPSISRDDDAAEVPDVRPTAPPTDRPVDGGEEEPPPEAAPADADDVADDEAPDAGAGDPDEVEPDSPPADAGPAAEPGAAEPTEAAAAEDAAAEDTAEGDARATAPSDSDLSRFVADRSEGALAVGHHVADLTGDGIRDVVVGRRSLDGRVELILGTWDGQVVTAAGHVEHRSSTGLGKLLVGDLDGDGRPDVLMPFVDRPRRGVLVASVTPSGALEAPAACPLSEPSPRTLGFGTGESEVWLACSQSEVRGSDGLVWANGVFAGAMPGGGRK